MSVLLLVVAADHLTPSHQAQQPKVKEIVADREDLRCTSRPCVFLEDLRSGKRFSYIYYYEDQKGLLTQMCTYRGEYSVSDELKYLDWCEVKTSDPTAGTCHRAQKSKTIWKQITGLPPGYTKYSEKDRQRVEAIITKAHIGPPQADPHCPDPSRRSH